MKIGPQVDEIFDDLASEVVQSESLREGRRDDRIWQLTRTVPLFFFKADRASDEVRECRQRLQTRALEVISGLPEVQERKRGIEALLRDHGLAFRPWKEEEQDVYRRLLNEEELWEFLPEEYPGHLDEAAARGLIAHSNEAPDRHEVFAVEWKGQVAGQARLQFDSDPDPSSAEISYWVGKPYWGQGLGTQIVAIFTARSFRSHPAINRIFARVLQGNAASVRVLEKAGYHREDYDFKGTRKAGTWVPEHVLCVFRRDYDFLKSRET